MQASSVRTLDRLGAASGGAAVVLLVALMMFFPSLPAADEPIAVIASDATRSEQMLLAGDYVGLLMGGLWLLFGVVVSCAVRREEQTSGGWWIVCLAGITTASAIGMLGNLFSVMFVRAVGHGLRDDALWTMYSGDLVGFAQAIPLAVFMLGAGLGTLATGIFPRWTGVLALATVPLLVIGAASVAGREVDGTPFILPLMLAYLGMLVWTVAGCVLLWQGRHGSVPEVVPEPA